MTQSSKNYTFSLPIELLTSLKKYASDGYVPSVNAAVKEAIESYVTQIEKEALNKEMKAAAEDPMFISDLKEAMSDFSCADFEALGENNK